MKTTKTKKTKSKGKYFATYASVEGREPRLYTGEVLGNLPEQKMLLAIYEQDTSGMEYYELWIIDAAEFEISLKSRFRTVAELRHGYQGYEGRNGSDTDTELTTVETGYYDGRGAPYVGNLTRFIDEEPESIMAFAAGTKSLFSEWTLRNITDGVSLSRLKQLGEFTSIRISQLENEEEFPF